MREEEKGGRRKDKKRKKSEEGIGTDGGMRERERRNRKSVEQWKKRTRR